MRCTSIRTRYTKYSRVNPINSPDSGILQRRNLTPYGWWIALLLMLGLARISKAQTSGLATDEQLQNITTGQVVAVEFQGNQSLSNDELSSIITTKATDWISRTIHGIPIAFISSLGSDYQALSQASLDRDTATIDRYYQDHGFIDARCTYAVRTNRDDLHNYYEQIRRERLTQAAGTKGAPLPQVRDTVIFTIREGTPYTISHVAIEGLESLPNEFQPELNDKVTIKSGQRWSSAAATNEAQRLTNFLVENGYPNARYDTIPVQHIAGHHDVDVLLYFRPGKRYRFGPVNIQYDTSSAEKTLIARKVILAQLYMDSGQWYKLSEIRRSEAALNKLGTFDLFRISLDTGYINMLPDSLRDSATVPIDISLRMKSVAVAPISVFAGQSSQGFVFGFGCGFTDKNLSQNADNLSVQGSYQPSPPSLLRYSGVIDYIRPFIGLPHIPLVTGLGYSHQIETVSPTDTFISISAHVGSNFVLSDTDNKTLLIPDFLVAYVNTQTTDSIIRATAPPQQVNLIPSISYQNDRTNDLVNPTAGYLYSASFEWGIPTKFLQYPSSDYLKFVPQVKYYFDLSHNGTAVLATHLRVGATYLMGDTGREPSLDRRFYGGGATSNRGWGEQSLLVSKSATDTALLGGYNDLEFNLELRYAPFQYPGAFTTWQQLSSPFRIVLFYDLGNVWDNIAWTNPGEALAFKMMAQTIGWGIRYNTFFGALRVDWGFKLYDPSGRFSESPQAITPGMTGGWLFQHGHNIFSIGNTSSLHFGIGQAF
jgi:outer membrane protein assembly factor BamA